MAGPKHGIHAARYVRYSRGQSPTTGRTLYGYRVECACGWTERVNGTLADARKAYKWHRQAP